MAIGVGSVPSGISEVCSEMLIPIKPMQTFLKHLALRFDMTIPRPGGHLKVTIVGGGVAGVEIALCLLTGLRVELQYIKVSICIVTADNDIAKELPAHARRKINRILAARGIDVVANARVSEVTESGVSIDDGRSYASDCVIWAAGAVAPPAIDCLGLPVVGV